MVLDPTIFATKPHMRLRWKKLDNTVDLKEGRREMAMPRAMEAAGGEEEDTLASHGREEDTRS